MIHVYQLVEIKQIVANKYLVFISFNEVDARNYDLIVLSRGGDINLEIFNEIIY